GEFLPTKAELKDQIEKKSLAVFCALDGATTIAAVLVRFGEKGAEISDVMVTNTRRRTGVATKLLQRVLETLRELNYNEITTKVAKNNDAAGSLFRSLSFEPGKEYRTPGQVLSVVPMTRRLSGDAPAIHKPPPEDIQKVRDQLGGETWVVRFA